MKVGPVVGCGVDDILPSFSVEDKDGVGKTSNSGGGVGGGSSVKSGGGGGGGGSVKFGGGGS